MSQYHMHRVIDIYLYVCIYIYIYVYIIDMIYMTYMYLIKENIFSHLYYTKALNECKFQHTSNTDKVKEKKLNTSIII